MNYRYKAIAQFAATAVLAALGGGVATHYVSQPAAPVGCLTHAELVDIAKAIHVDVNPVFRVPKDSIKIEKQKDWLDVYVHPVGEKPTPDLQINGVRR